MESKDTNKVVIVGLLSENNVEQRSKDGRNYVTGNFKIKTDDTNEVAVNVFAFEDTKKGTKNPAYTQIMSVCDKGISLAACGGDTTKATKHPVNRINISRGVTDTPFKINLTSFSNDAPAITGIAKKKVNLAAIFLFKPTSSPPIIVAPLLLVPGIKASN